MDLESATGKTNIEAGIELGLQLLDNSAHLNQSSRCSQVLLLLTDGVTSVTHFTIVNKYEIYIYTTFKYNINNTYI